MNLISKILNELALEFQIPQAIDKNLFQRIFRQRKNKQEGITEKTNDGRIKRIGDKGSSG